MKKFLLSLIMMWSSISMANVVQMNCFYKNVRVKLLNKPSIDLWDGSYGPLEFLIGDEDAKDTFHLEARYTNQYLKLDLRKTVGMGYYLGRFVNSKNQNVQIKCPIGDVQRFRRSFDEDNIGFE